jgi:ABC-type antimicrobial peptide transport system permease subunit
MAVGAGRSEVVRMVLRQGLTLILCGLGAGLILSFGARQAMLAAFPIHDRQATEVAVYPLLTIALLVVTMLAAYIPARRASRVDPIQALRHE